MIKIIDSVCRNCGKIFKKISEDYKGIVRQIPINIRSRKAVTCSPKCSVDYNYNNIHKTTYMKNGEIFKK